MKSVIAITGIFGFSVLTKRWDIGTASHGGQGWDTVGDEA